MAQRESSSKQKNNDSSVSEMEVQEQEDILAQGNFYAVASLYHDGTWHYFFFYRLVQSLLNHSQHIINSSTGHQDFLPSHKEKGMVKRQNSHHSHE